MMFYRYQEQLCDQHAVRLGYGSELNAALSKMETILGDLDFHPLMHIHSSTHPSYKDRCAAIDQAMKEKSPAMVPSSAESPIGQLKVKPIEYTQ